MRGNELKLDRVHHVLYSKPCKKQIQGKIQRFHREARGRDICENGWMAGALRSTRIIGRRGPASTSSDAQLQNTQRRMGTESYCRTFAEPIIILLRSCMRGLSARRQRHWAVAAVTTGMWETGARYWKNTRVWSKYGEALIYSEIPKASASRAGNAYSFPLPLMPLSDEENFAVSSRCSGAAVTFRRRE